MAKPEHPPFWMVHGIGQRAPVVQHLSEADAIEEARRLAREHHGIRFFVLAASRGFMTADPVIEIAIDDGIPF